MGRPLIGVDLDGVIAKEDRVKYFIAKAEGASSLLHYYKNLKPDKEFVNQLYLNRHKYDYEIFTARKDDLPNIKNLTHSWLMDNDLIDLLGWGTFTKWRWKGPELYFYGVKAHIDNDYDNLARLPFIHRLAYKSYSRSNYSKLLLAPNICTNNAKEIFAYLDQVCYNSK